MSYGFNCDKMIDGWISQGMPTKNNKELNYYLLIVSTKPFIHLKINFK